MQPTKPVYLIFFVFIICITSLSSKAQPKKGEVQISAEYNYYKDKYYYFHIDDYSSKIFVQCFGTKVGFAVSEVWSIGVGFEYSKHMKSDNNTRIYALSLFGRYNYNLYKKLYLYGNVVTQTGLLVTTPESTTGNPNRTVLVAETNVGVSYFFSPSFCLDIKAASIGFEQYSDYANGRYTNVNPQIYPVGVGLSLFL